MLYVQWTLLAIVDFVFKIANIFLAPIVILFQKDGWLPNWLSWFQTPDNSLDGDNGWKTEHLLWLNAKGDSFDPFRIYLKRVLWIIRNPTWIGNAFTQKTLSGSFLVKNKHLEKLLDSKNQNTKQVWKDIISHEGSVQHLEFLTEEEKEVFKTAFELDQRWIVEHASVRQQYVDQAISTNIFLRADIHKKDLNAIHMLAWNKGLKSLYYCRSKSLQQADRISNKIAREEITEEAIKYEECLGCQ